MCTRHDSDFYREFAGDKCAYCLQPDSIGVAPYKAEGHPVKLCLPCDKRMKLQRLLDNFHEFEPVSTVEVYA